MKCSPALQRMFSVGIVFLAAGCGWWNVGAATLTMVPRIFQRESGAVSAQRVDSSRISPAHSVSWQRRVTPADDPASSYSSESPVLVEWHIPLETGPGVEAVAAISDASCLARSARPTHWQVIAASTGQSVGEAWWVDPNLGQEVDLYSKRLGWVRADAAAAAAELPDRYRISWILIIPKPDRYVFQVAWKDAPSAELMAVEPCIAGWTNLPLSVAIASTTQGMRERSAATSVSYAPVHDALKDSGDARFPNTSDEGASLGLLHEGDKGENVFHLPQPLELGLVGAPTYDLVRLHQWAVSIEVGAQTPSRQTIEVLRRERTRALAALANQETLCILSRRYTLSEWNLTIWGGEATVPIQLLTHCMK